MLLYPIVLVSLAVHLVIDEVLISSIICSIFPCISATAIVGHSCLYSVINHTIIPEVSVPFGVLTALRF